MADNPLANKHQAWSALFSEPMSELVQRYATGKPIKRIIVVPGRLINVVV